MGVVYNGSWVELSWVNVVWDTGCETLPATLAGTAAVTKSEYSGGAQTSLSSSPLDKGFAAILIYFCYG